MSQCAHCACHTELKGYLLTYLLTYLLSIEIGLHKDVESHCDSVSVTSTLLKTCNKRT